MSIHSLARRTATLEVKETAKSKITITAFNNIVHSIPTEYKEFEGKPLDQLKAAHREIDFHVINFSVG